MRFSPQSPPFKNTLKIEAQILYNGKRHYARKIVRQNLTNIMFNEKIKEYRKKLNLTQEQLAEQLNFTDRAISKWETGRGMPDS